MSGAADRSALSTLLQHGDLAQALAVATARVEHDPADVEANQAIGEIRLMQGLYAEAEAALRRVLESSPENERGLVLMAGLEAARGRTAAGLAWCDRLEQVHPGSLPGLLKRAELLERSGATEATISLLQGSDRLSGNVVAAQILARAFIASKRPAEAIPIIDSCLGSWAAAAVATPAQQSRLLHLRAKANDALGNYEQAFADATAGKESVRVPFDVEAYVAEIDGIINTFSAAAMRPPADFAAEALQHVFIAGLPRSGTTLVEQILDAHPDATGVGEAKEIHIAATRLQQRLNSWVPWPACAGGLTGPQRRDMSREYEEALTSFGYDPATLLINKHLLNLRFLGFIAMLFPQSRVVFCHRDPRDMGLSCFLANMSSRVHPELQAIEDVAMAIRQADRLVDHWKDNLPLQWMEVRYEDMVADHERVSRELIAFCDLPWDERCLSFFASGRTVMTLSYDQVNQPIYATSVNRYRNYEQHLTPLMSL